MVTLKQLNYAVHTLSQPRSECSTKYVHCALCSVRGLSVPGPLSTADYTSTDSIARSDRLVY